MPEVTCGCETLVAFTIRGEQIGDGRWREDGGLVSRFIAWQLEADVFPAFCCSSGGGQWRGAFFPEDAVKVDRWMRENGVVRVAWVT